MRYSESAEGELYKVGLCEETICQLWYIHLATHKFVQHDACLHHDVALLETVLKDGHADTDILHDQVFLNSLGGQVSLYHVDLSLMMNHTDFVVGSLIFLVVVLDELQAHLFKENTELGWELD